MVQKQYIDSDWKRWIAENVLLGRPREELTRVLVEKGFDEAHSRLEVDTAANHPYLASAQAVVRQLAKRDWVLHTQRMLQESGVNPVAEQSDSIELTQFNEFYYAANRPIVIRGGANELPAIKKWTPEFLIETAGESEVEVQANRNSDPSYEIQNLKHRDRCRFGDFVKRVFEGGETNDFYMTANNSELNGKALAEFWPDTRPLPKMLSEDLAEGRMFFWMGPAGTVTPLHHDLTNNLMVQVAGHKRV